jgi:hypothetical protein
MVVPSWTCSFYLRPFSARGESDLNTCIGVDFDAKRPLIASRVTTRPHVNFVKGSEDDAACPADKESCRKKAFLVPGDVVLTGRAQGAFTCVAYQYLRKPDWTTGWLPTSSLSPVEPMRSPKMPDWIGSWSHPGGIQSRFRVARTEHCASKANRYIPQRVAPTVVCSARRLRRRKA